MPKKAKKQITLHEKIGNTTLRFHMKAPVPIANALRVSIFQGNRGPVLEAESPIHDIKKTISNLQVPLGISEKIAFVLDVENKTNEVMEVRPKHFVCHNDETNKAVKNPIAKNPCILTLLKPGESVQLTAKINPDSSQNKAFAYYEELGENEYLLSVENRGMSPDEAYGRAVDWIIERFNLLLERLQSEHDSAVKDEGGETKGSDDGKHYQEFLFSENGLYIFADILSMVLNEQEETISCGVVRNHRSDASVTLVLNTTSNPVESMLAALRSAIDLVKKYKL